MSSSHKPSDTAPVTWNQKELCFETVTHERTRWKRTLPRHERLGEEHQKCLWIAYQMPDLEADDVAKLTRKMPYEKEVHKIWSIDRMMYVAKCIERMSRNPPRETRDHWDKVTSKDVRIERDIRRERDLLDAENLKHDSTKGEGIVIRMSNNRPKTGSRKFGLRQQKFIFHAYTEGVSSAAIAKALPKVGFANSEYIKMRMYPKFVEYIRNQRWTGNAEEQDHWETVMHPDPGTASEIHNFIDMNDRSPQDASKTGRRGQERGSNSPRRSSSREPVYRDRDPEYQMDEHYRANRNTAEWQRTLVRDAQQSQRPSFRLPEDAQATRTPRHFQLLSGDILQYHPGGTSKPRLLTKRQQGVIYNSCRHLGRSADETFKILYADCQQEKEKFPLGLNADDIEQIVKYMGDKVTDPHTGVGHYWTSVTRYDGQKIDKAKKIIEKYKISKALKTQSLTTTEIAEYGSGLDSTGASRTARSDQSLPPPPRHEPHRQTSRSPSLSPAPQDPPRRRITQQERARDLGYTVVEAARVQTPRRENLPPSSSYVSGGVRYHAPPAGQIAGGPPAPQTPIRYEDPQHQAGYHAGSTNTTRQADYVQPSDFSQPVVHQQSLYPQGAYQQGAYQQGAYQQGAYQQPYSQEVYQRGFVPYNPTTQNQPLRDQPPANLSRSQPSSNQGSRQQGSSGQGSKDKSSQDRKPTGQGRRRR